MKQLNYTDTLKNKLERNKEDIEYHKNMVWELEVINTAIEAELVGGDE